MDAEIERIAKEEEIKLNEADREFIGKMDACLAEISPANDLAVRTEKRAKEFKPFLTPTGVKLLLWTLYLAATGIFSLILPEAFVPVFALFVLFDFPTNAFESIRREVGERNGVRAAASKPPLTFAELAALDGNEIEEDFPEHNVIKVGNGYYHLTPACMRVLLNEEKIDCELFVKYMKKLQNLKKLADKSGL